MKEIPGEHPDSCKPAPSAGWENKLFQVVNDYRWDEADKEDVLKVFRSAVAEAEDSAYLKAQGEYRDMLAFNHRCDLLHGFDEAVTIAGYGTREVQAKLHDKRRELEKN